ncbi:hypothetical protein B0H11DRAFT_1916327 [Mycena galericulata]|nr:hypothetical protein B0H11DRAFT_1916327 [Mycena galericulata]
MDVWQYFRFTCTKPKLGHNPSVVHKPTWRHWRGLRARSSSETPRRSFTSPSLQVYPCKAERPHRSQALSLRRCPREAEAWTMSAPSLAVVLFTRSRLRRNVDLSPQDTRCGYLRVADLKAGVRSQDTRCADLKAGVRSQDTRCGNPRVADLDTMWTLAPGHSLLSARSRLEGGRPVARHSLRLPARSRLGRMKSAQEDMFNRGNEARAKHALQWGHRNWGPSVFTGAERVRLASTNALDLLYMFERGRSVPKPHTRRRGESASGVACAAAAGGTKEYKGCAESRGRMCGLDVDEALGLHATSVKAESGAPSASIPHAESDPACFYFGTRA